MMSHVSYSSILSQANPCLVQKVRINNLTGTSYATNYTERILPCNYYILRTIQLPQWARDAWCPRKRKSVRSMSLFFPVPSICTASTASCIRIQSPEDWNWTHLIKNVYQFSKKGFYIAVSECKYSFLPFVSYDLMQIERKDNTLPRLLHLPIK